jgi:hypothetical protein
MLPWDARVAREAAYEACIEAAFDHAEAYALDGKLERALESLSEAERLAGGLPEAYTEQRERWISALAQPAVVARR